ncbi:MAG: hypothetical protein R3192_17290 [Woeseiaceae bacterium]|nr:hypothetical protein [Woeseiaceae bacterium]
MTELADVLASLERLGYEPFDLQRDVVPISVTDTIYLDAGTDPGDDVAIYLLETGSIARRYLLLSDSFHVDPQKARLIDEITASRKSG